LIGVLRVHPRVTFPSGPVDVTRRSSEPLGRLIALEVKRPGEKPRPEQVRFLELVRRFGGFAAVVTSPEDALAAIERARGGVSE
jgi:hypothetical protein